MGTELTPFWEKLKIGSTIIASIAIPLVIAFVGNSYSNDQKERELSLRYVELSIGILRAEPAKQTQQLRAWAIEVINKYSQVPLPKDLMRDLEKQTLTLEDIYLRMSAELKREHQRKMKEIEEMRL
jgi:hypothetical protein